MTDDEAEYLRGLKRRAQSVLADLESGGAPSPEMEERRRRIIERFRTVLDEAEASLADRKEE